MSNKQKASEVSGEESDLIQDVEKLINGYKYLLQKVLIQEGNEQSAEIACNAPVVKLVRDKIDKLREAPKHYPVWRLATENDLIDMGSKHWRDGNKMPISVGLAYRMINELKETVEVLDESQPTTSIPIRESVEEPKEDHGMCKEKCCSRKAVRDYNGHGHWVCESHYKSLSDYFDEEYK